MPRKSYREVFPKRHTFLPVIHVQNAGQAERNTRLALSEGADGVFLINHYTNAAHLLSCYRYVREHHSNAWIGLNLLGQHRADALRMVEDMHDVSGLWADSGVNDGYEGSKLNVREFCLSLEASSFKGLYFGGVAFKGRHQPPDPGRMASLVAPYMDVVTTSGEETGSPPALSKIVGMKEAIPGGVLANASGLGPENVGPYLPHLDCFLVATKIGSDFHNLDPAKVSAFARQMEK